MPPNNRSTLAGRVLLENECFKILSGLAGYGIPRQNITCCKTGSGSPHSSDLLIGGEGSGETGPSQSVSTSNSEGMAWLGTDHPGARQGSDPGPDLITSLFSPSPQLTTTPVTTSGQGFRFGQHFS